MTSLQSRSTDGDRATSALEEAIERLGIERFRGVPESADLRTRIGDAGTRLGDAGAKIADAGSRIAESGVETARALVREARGLPTLAQGAASRARGVASDVAADLASSVPIRIQVGKPPRRPLLPLVAVGLVTAAVGAVIAFLFDPQMGRGRRAVAADRVAAGARRANRWSAGQRRRVAATATAVRDQIRNTGAVAEPADEVALAQRVKSELFRDPEVDKGSINVNAERDVVFLRGTASNEDRINDIARRVEEIAGVRKVVNLLHVPGAPVPVMGQDATEEGDEASAERASWAIPH